MACEKFSSCIALLSRKIARYSEQLYGVPHTPETLYQSWLLRKNYPMAHQGDGSVEGLLWCPDQTLIQKSSPASVQLWRRYLNSALDTNNKFGQVIAIFFGTAGEFETRADTEVISNLELELYTVVQDLLLEKYSRKGIILEACPTSNITIGRFKSYAEHPIFRWNPPIADWLNRDGEFNRYGIRTGAVAVCINTDDAGLMPTTLENEHYLIEMTAVNKLNVCPIVAKKWIEAIQNQGNEIFQSNHLDWEL